MSNLENFRNETCEDFKDIYTNANDLDNLFSNTHILKYSYGSERGSYNHGYSVYYWTPKEVLNQNNNKNKYIIIIVNHGSCPGCDDFEKWDTYVECIDGLNIVSDYNLKDLQIKAYEEVPLKISSEAYPTDNSLKVILDELFKD